MKKMLAALLAAVLTLCFAAALAEDTGLADVKAKGTLVMGFDEEYPPMGFVDENGEYVGFDIDLAKEVTDRLGVELVLQPISWDSKELELSGKNIDCIWSGLTMTPERIEQMTFSIPYLANEQILVVRSDSGIASEADLSGKVLGTQAGSSSVDVLNANPDLMAAIGEPQLYDGFVTALMDLKLGGIDVLLIDSVVGNYYIAQQDDPARGAGGRGIRHCLPQGRTDPRRRGEPAAHRYVQRRHAGYHPRQVVRQRHHAGRPIRELTNSHFLPEGGENGPFRPYHLFGGLHAIFQQFRCVYEARAFHDGRIL